MTLFDDVLEISARLDEVFPRQDPSDDQESLVTILVSDDEFDAISAEASGASTKAGGPEVRVTSDHVIVKNVRWLPRSSARADYE